MQTIERSEPMYITSPQISNETKIKYAERYRQLRQRFCREQQVSEMSPEEVVANLILLKPNLAMSTWRQYKAATLYFLETHHPHADQAQEVLASEGSSGLRKRGLRTSGKKAKEVPDKTWNQLKRVLRERANKGYRHSGGLLAVLEATLKTGLRPNEWCFSEIASHSETGRTVLRIKNSKHSNGRANGEHREIFIDELPESEIEIVRQALAYCQSDSSEQSQQIFLSLKNELWLVRKGLQSVKKGRAIPVPKQNVTIYSFRHQFLANAKLTFDDPAIIAALAGHSSTKTAFEHYGKRRHAKSKVQVSPTPESVEAVQKRTLEMYKEFTANRRNTGAMPD